MKTNDKIEFCIDSFYLSTGFFSTADATQKELKKRCKNEDARQMNQ